MFRNPPSSVRAAEKAAKEMHGELRYYASLKQKPCYPHNRKLCAFFAKNGLTVYLDNPKMEKMVMGQVAILEEANEMMLDGDKMTALVVHDHNIGLPKGLDRDQIHFIPFPHFNMVRCMSGVIESENPKVYLFHEAAHAYFESLGPDQKEIMEKLYNSFASCCARDAALLRLFCEGSYFNGRRGHPEDSREELFASASNVILNFFPDMWKAADRLGKGARHTANEIMVATYLIWENGKMFCKKANVSIEEIAQRDFLYLKKSLSGQLP